MVGIVCIPSYQNACELKNNNQQINICQFLWWFRTKNVCKNPSISGGRGYDQSWSDIVESNKLVQHNWHIAISKSDLHPSLPFTASPEHLPERLSSSANMLLQVSLSNQRCITMWWQRSRSLSAAALWDPHWFSKPPLLSNGYLILLLLLLIIFKSRWSSGVPHLLVCSSRTGYCCYAGDEMLNQ